MLLVKFQKTKQVNPDDYEVVWCEKLFNRDTKLKKIIQWVVKEWATDNIYSENTLPNLSLTIPQIDK